jgi:uncharacterized protein (TIGR03118 family)
MTVKRTLRIGLAGATVALLVPLGAAPARADDDGAAAAPRVTQINQVSDDPAQHPKLIDPNVVNAWGLALSPTSPLWVANNGTNTATLYPGGLNGAAVSPSPFVVQIPGGAPTGQVFNGTGQFVVTGTKDDGTPGSGSAVFIFDSEGGDITGWSPAISRTHAFVAAHVDGASYKGLALLQSPFGPLLLAADFANGRIDVFDRTFQRLTLPHQFFNDPKLPKGYAPFNVMVNGDTVYVAYAKKEAGGDEEQAGPGLGIVDAFTDIGLTMRRVASHGTLNAPWGLAIAPASFGRFAGALLVGNFGDGRIGAYRGDHFLGQLRDTSGHRLAIDGLWALQPGTAASGGVGTLWFSAGPDDESHGLVGQLIPAV